MLPHSLIYAPNRRSHLLEDLRHGLRVLARLKHGGLAQSLGREQRALVGLTAHDCLLGNGSISAIKLRGASIRTASLVTGILWAATFLTPTLKLDIR